MRVFALVVPLLLITALPTADAQIRRPRLGTRADTTRAPEPGRVPCSIDCTALQHESWHQFDSQIDAGLSGGSAHVATDAQGGLSVPRLQGTVGWMRRIAEWQFGSSLDLWSVPSVDGVNGWGTDVLLRAGRTLFEGGPELRVGAGLGLDRIKVTLPSRVPMDETHAGLAYEATAAQEFRRESSVGYVLSAGVVGMSGDGTFPRMPSAVFVAGLGLRWHRWSATEHDAQRRTRNGPRWPRPLP